MEINVSQGVEGLLLEKEMISTIRYFAFVIVSTGKDGKKSYVKHWKQMSFAL